MAIELPDHVGLHTSSEQGAMKRDEEVRNVNRGVEGKHASQGTDVAREGGREGGMVEGLRRVKRKD